MSAQLLLDLLDESIEAPVELISAGLRPQAPHHLALPMHGRIGGTHVIRSNQFRTSGVEQWSQRRQERRTAITGSAQALHLNRQHRGPIGQRRNHGGLQRAQDGWMLPLDGGAKRTHVHIQTAGLQLIHQCSDVGAGAPLGEGLHGELDSDPHPHTLRTPRATVPA